MSADITSAPGIGGTGRRSVIFAAQASGRRGFCVVGPEAAALAGGLIGAGVGAAIWRRRPTCGALERDSLLRRGCTAMWNRNRSMLWPIVGVLVVASAAEAQDRRGVTMSLHGGYGSARVSCDDCARGDRESAPAGGLILGWGLNERLVVGASLDFWTQDRDLRPDLRSTIDFYTFSGTLTVYPLRTAGLFVRGGAGAAFVDNEVRGRGSRVTYDLGSGIGAMAGVGYDIRIGRRWFVTPMLNVVHGRPGDLRVLDDLVERNFRFSVVSATVGITFQ
jgi:hypothetical protein